LLRSKQHGIGCPLMTVVTFEEARRGFMAAPNYLQIMAHAGHVAWDMGSFDFLLEGRVQGVTINEIDRLGKGVVRRVCDQPDHSGHR
jgi:alkyl sulfatase BDS1-like metallo-beta-lactamase superfamily hydrolase